MTLKNSILANVLNPTIGVTPPTTFNAGSLPIFATAGAGAHYLDVDKAWVQAANVTGTIAAPLNSELVGMTVRPPGVLPAAVTSDLTLRALPIAEGTDSTKWRWGYHYWPVHYLAPGTTVTGATVTLTNGVVVAGTEGTAFMLNSGGKFVSTGRPDAMDRLVYASTVQEQPSAVVPNLTARRFLDVATGTPAVRPEVRLRFTAMDHPADAASRRALLNVDNRFVGVTDIRDSQFRGVKFTLAPAASPSPAQTVTFVNNLWQTCDVTVYRFYDANLPAVLRNNLFNGGSLSLQYTSFGSNPSWTVRDNLFDATTLGTSIPGASLVGGWNGYSAATALFGGSGNVLNLATGGSGGYQAGPLGGFYYPITGTTGLNTLRNVGSQAADLAGLYHHTTQTDQAKEAATKVDIGFHYVATTGSASTALPDADADTLPDYLEDTNGSGVQNGTETAWQNADSDADGALDQEEIAGGTDPLSKASWIPKRLAYWSFDGTSTVPSDANYWKRGDRGQAPLQDSNGSRDVYSVPNTGGVLGNGVKLPKTTTGRLSYRVREGDGRLNVRVDQGSIRFWFKPDWTFTSQNPTLNNQINNTAPLSAAGYPTANLFSVGDVFPSATYWGWCLEYLPKSSTDQIPGYYVASGLRLKLWQGGSDAPAIAPPIPPPAMSPYVPHFEGGAFPRIDLPVTLHSGLSHLGNWTVPNQWHQLDLSYMDRGLSQTGIIGYTTGTPPQPISGPVYGLGTWIQEDGTVQAWNKTTPPAEPQYIYGGLGTYAPILPPANTTQGFTMGSDSTGVFSQADGTYDSVETFNWPLGEVDNYTAQQITATATAPGQLQFSRPRYGGPQVPSSVGQLTAGTRLLTLYRRALGAAVWGSAMVSGSTAESFVTTLPQAGTAYEHKVELASSSAGTMVRQFVAGTEMPLQHYRGHVILLVDTTLATGLTTELAQLRQQLVGDGWSVKQLSAPRHDDQNDTTGAVNKANRIAVSNLIRDSNNRVPNVLNVVFIVGHVTIPTAVPRHMTAITPTTKALGSAMPITATRATLTRMVPPNGQTRRISRRATNMRLPMTASSTRASCQDLPTTPWAGLILPGCRRSHH